MEMRLTPVCHAVDVASPAERARLGLSAGKRVVRLDRLRYAGGNIRTFERSVLPVHRVPGIQVDRAQHLTLPQIAKAFGLELGKATERLSISQAPPEIALRLDVSPTQDFVQIERTTTTVDEVPIEWCVVYAMEISS
jgi:GntR family transcriptional regulator